MSDSLIEKQVRVLRDATEIMSLLETYLPETSKRELAELLTKTLVSTLSGETLVCVRPGCGGKLRMKRRHDQGTRFYGCSNFPYCKEALPYDDAVRITLEKVVYRLRKEIK